MNQSAGRLVWRQFRGDGQRHTYPLIEIAGEPYGERLMGNGGCTPHAYADALETLRHP